jgi:virulence factor
MRSTYVPALLSLTEEFEVAAICDLNEAVAREVAKSFGSAVVFTDADQMLQAGGLDAVLVLTSEKVNAAMAQCVLKSGLPVYLEKPPAVNPVQLEELIEAEKRSSSFIYTAFNRRHTPLFANLDLGGEKILKVSGALRRKGRVVATFPHTSIHLIDSAQHFVGSLFAEWKVEFKKLAEHSIWEVTGKFMNGADVALEFVPDGADFAEYLVLESDGRRWELQFPNTEAAVPEGEIIAGATDGSPPGRTRGNPSLPSFEAMGFRPCLLDFAAQLNGKNRSPLHQLSSCRATIGVMGEMEAAVLLRT